MNGTGKTFSAAMTSGLDEYYKPGAPGSDAHLFSPQAFDARDAEVRLQFANGQGVLVLQPSMPDVALLAVLKFAIDASKGKSFVVVPPSA